MGAVPKRKISKGRKNRRRLGDVLKEPAMSKCPKCGETKRPHFMCQNCGYYGEGESKTEKKANAGKSKSKKTKTKSEKKASSKKKSKSPKKKNEKKK